MVSWRANTLFSAVILKFLRETSPSVWVKIARFRAGPAESCAPRSAGRSRLTLPSSAVSPLQSDPDLPADAQTPSSAELGRYPGLPFPAPQYVPPQPSIEEARQTMHSLLDDAFALVAPSSQPANATAAGPGAPAGLPVSSTPSREERRATQWGSFYSPAQTASTPCGVSMGLLALPGLGPCRFFPSESFPCVRCQRELSSSGTKMTGRTSYCLPASGLEVRVSGWWLTSKMLFIGVDRADTLRGQHKVSPQVTGGLVSVSGVRRSGETIILYKVFPLVFSVPAWRHTYLVQYD